MTAKKRPRHNRRPAIPEKELTQRVLDLFPDSEYLAAEEVPLRLKRIDLLFKAMHGRGQTTAVEIKVANWRRGLWQAATYGLVADYVYLALWEPRVHLVPVDVIRQLGLGMIQVGVDHAEIVVRARKSTTKRKELAKEVEKAAGFS